MADSMITKQALAASIKELMEREWYLEANMSKYLAAIVNSFNHDISIGAALSPTIKIQKLLQKFHAGKTE